MDRPFQTLARDNCVVFLCETPHPLRCINRQGVTLSAAIRLAFHSGGSTPTCTRSFFMLKKLEISAGLMGHLAPVTERDTDILLKPRSPIKCERI